MGRQPSRCYVLDGRQEDFPPIREQFGANLPLSLPLSPRHISYWRGDALIRTADKYKYSS